jgi:hypothetical protein
MTAYQVASVCMRVALMARTRPELEAWVASNRPTIERTIPGHADDVIRFAREHWRRLS